jgi:4-diphosphocytidyl-2-C-methyl-D-erythritol kinase
VSEAPDTAVVEARAKVNLFLRVLGRRRDGYHDLETLIVPIDLADRLRIHALSDPAQFRSLSLSLEVSGEPSLVGGVPVDESNLVLKAASALADRTEARGFAEIHLEKRVPPAGGLGGGSADAAATLRVLNRLWACGLSADDLEAVAADVGSDVPALLAGGAVLARGRGEEVEPKGTPSLNLALATFSFGVSSADAFRWWDEDGATTGPDPAPILSEVERLAESEGEGEGGPKRVAEFLFNDLEGPVVRRHPVIGEVKSKLLAAGAVGALMSGSGPTLFAILPWGVDRLDGWADEDIARLAGRPLLYVGSGADTAMTA